MADILIRGIELPKEPTPLTLYPDGRWNDYTDGANGKFLLLEGHGKLVDANELKNRINRKMSACKPNAVDELTYAVCIDIVDHADPIVPAEGGGEDGK